MTRSELREHVFKMLFQIEFNEAINSCTVWRRYPSIKRCSLY